MDWEQIAYDLYIIAGRFINDEFQKQYNVIKQKYLNPSNEIEQKISRLINVIEKEDKELLEILINFEKFFADKLQEKFSKENLYTAEEDCSIPKNFGRKKWWI